MYLQNKYAIWYDKIISNAISRTVHGYTEKHHIIPKSLGGTNDKSNIVRLTAREHYICHLLLTKMTEGLMRRKMLFAHWRMMHGNNNQERYILSNAQYEKVKEAMSLAVKEQNAGKVLAKTSNKGRVPWNKGKTGVMSVEAKMKIRQHRIGKNLSVETKQKISNSSHQHTCNTSGARPRINWTMQNILTGEISYTTNLKQWCKDHNFNSGMIYLDRSDWKILEKRSIKTGELLS